PSSSSTRMMRSTLPVIGMAHLRKDRVGPGSGPAGELQQRTRGDLETNRLLMVYDKIGQGSSPLKCMGSVKGAEIRGDIDGIALEYFQRNDPQHRGVGGCQHNRCGHAVFVGTKPVGGGDTPA